MTAAIRQIIAELNVLVRHKLDMSASDEDLIANIEAINLLCNLHDDLGLEQPQICKRLPHFYSQFVCRISGKENIQLAVPLIRGLYSLIYGRTDGCAPETWISAFEQLCARVVDAYNKKPLISPTDYLFALHTASRVNLDCDYCGYRQAVADLLQGIDTAPVSEKIRRAKACALSQHLFSPDNWEEWADQMEQIKHQDIEQLDDDTFLLWCDLLDCWPKKELRKRSGHSILIHVEYLRSLTIAEFDRQQKQKARRRLAKDLKALSAPIIADILPIKVSATMDLSTLHALASAFFQRFLSDEATDDRAAVYSALCRSRYIVPPLYRSHPLLNRP